MLKRVPDFSNAFRLTCDSCGDESPLFWAVGPVEAREWAKTCCGWDTSWQCDICSKCAKASSGKRCQAMRQGRPQLPHNIKQRGSEGMTKSELYDEFKETYGFKSGSDEDINNILDLLYDKGILYDNCQSNHPKQTECRADYEPANLKMRLDQYRKDFEILRGNFITFRKEIENRLKVIEQQFDRLKGRISDYEVAIDGIYAGNIGGLKDVIEAAVKDQYIEVQKQVNDVHAMVNDLRKGIIPSGLMNSIDNQIENTVARREAG